jgi:hypothetical protein
MLDLLTVRSGRWRSVLVFTRLHGKLVKSFAIGAVISLAIGIAIVGVLTTSPVGPAERGQRPAGSATPASAYPRGSASAAER